MRIKVSMIRGVSSICLGSCDTRSLHFIAKQILLIMKKFINIIIVQMPVNFDIKMIQNAQEIMKTLDKIYSSFQMFIILYRIQKQIIQSKMLNQEDQNPSIYYKSSKKLPINVSQSILNKISNHLQIQKIGIDEFWLSEKNFARPEEIIEFCKQRGLILDEHDCTILKGQLFPRNETISLQNLVQSLPCWSRQNRQVLRQFHLKRSDRMVLLHENKKKERARSGLSRPKSQIIQPRSRPVSGVRTNAETSGKIGISKNNSMKYLQRFRDKELAKQKELSENIEKNKIDEEYGMLVKMSELNAINKDRDNNIAYRAYKTAEGLIKVKIFNLNKLQKQISLKQFDTIYKNFKKTTKENKDWTFTPTSTLKQGDELQMLKNRNSQKVQRQQQLKNLLYNTVNLTNLLKEQIKIFKMKGIYGCENI